MNMRIFHPHKFRGNGMSGRTMLNPNKLYNIPITIILRPLENILLRITLLGSFPLLLLILNITLKAERNTNSDGPNISNAAYTSPYT